MPSKRYKKLPDNTSELNSDLIEKLLPEVKKNCTTKFDESVDLSFQINNKQKKSEVNIRTVVNLPGGTGKDVKVAVVCEDAKSKDAKDAGADIVGGDEFIDKIKALILSINSSPPTISAPASFASFDFASSQTTATFTSLPVPPGKFTTVLIFTSLFFCLLFIWKLRSTDSSNFVVQFFLTSGKSFSIKSEFSSEVLSGNFLYLLDGITL